jgi:hypothetical protein
MARKTTSQNLELFSFSTSFLRDHAGHIIADPKTAITELIANSYDAGATVVDIVWPDGDVGRFSITDNGTGMAREEFGRRWKTLSYERLKEQGPNVEFPPGVPKRKRTAFGRNGKGRHAAFCFADRYVVETRKGGRRLVVEVQSQKAVRRHFDVRQNRKKMHQIWCPVPPFLRNFSADPSPRLMSLRS